MTDREPLRGESVPEGLPAGKTTSDPWVSTRRVVAHPDAAQGGGGAGVFRDAGQLGRDKDEDEPVPHPLSPKARELDPDLLKDKAIALDATTQQPAPVQSADEDKNVGGIVVTVKKDARSVGGVTGAVTSFTLDAGSVPGVETDDKGKITKIDGPMPVVTGQIQTQYGVGEAPDGKSAYGRGTTDDDKAKGNTSLGFHESCHRQDHLDFVGSHTVPKFGGTVGMTEAQWKAATDKYFDAVNKYFKASDEASAKKTDEVGNPTRAEYKKTHP